MFYIDYTLKQLFKIGLHLGHHKSVWNPEMFKFLWGTRLNNHLLDLKISILILRRVFFLVKNIILTKGAFVILHHTFFSQYYFKNYFLNWRKYVYFLGFTKKFRGLISNYKTFVTTIQKLNAIKGLMENNSLNLINFHSSRIYKNKVLFKEKLSLFDGLMFYKKLPDFIFVLSSLQDFNFINEAHKVKIPVGALMDSNFYHSTIDFPIPGNDDSLDILNFFCYFFKKIIEFGVYEKKLNLLNKSGLKNNLSFKSKLKTIKNK